MIILSILFMPLAGAFVLGLYGHRPWAFAANIGFSAATAVATAVMTARVLAHGPFLALHDQAFVDPFNVFLVDLTAFVTLTTAVFSRAYMHIESHMGRLTAGRLRLYHSMFQLFALTMLVALLTNNIGILWVAMEGATLSTTLLVSLYRTPASLEAAWKYFILCGVGIALALFGTIMLYFSAHALIGGQASLLWTDLDRVRTRLDPTIVGVAFAFLLLGYGTKVGLVPVHNWLPDAHAEGPTPISAVLSGLLLNVALYAVVRFQVLADGSLRDRWPNQLMMAFGLLSVLVAAFSLARQRDIKRLLSYSSIEHMGLATFAFGMGGPIAIFAALLHMTVHSLTKSSLFFSGGHIAQKTGTQRIDQIQGLLGRNPAMGWAFMLGTLAILGTPPFGVFTSEFLILTVAIHKEPWALPFLAVGLGVAFAALFGRMQAMVFGETRVPKAPAPTSLWPSFLHLALVLTLGLAIPPALSRWYTAAARLLGH
ncbi:MAG: hydrogenase 4 subunit F [Gammaproteobacteria bacterium]|nr:hydrogenase 4 subunit F [Gammaproteobacteria bacterium]